MIDDTTTQMYAAVFKGKKDSLEILLGGTLKDETAIIKTKTIHGDMEFAQTKKLKLLVTWLDWCGSTRMSLDNRINKAEKCYWKYK